MTPEQKATARQVFAALLATEQSKQGFAHRADAVIAERALEAAEIFERVYWERRPVMPVPPAEAAHVPPDPPRPLPGKQGKRR